MRKIKLALTFIGVLIGFGLLTKSTLAIGPSMVIQKLPDYVNYQDFKLSYSALTDNPGDIIQVQFYFNKDGGSFSAFGGIQTGASGQVSVTSSQMGESGKKYCFKAEIVGTGGSDQTCTTFDNSAPDSPGGFSKERLGPSTYKIKWHTPNNDDFAQVYIYRSDNPDFSADDSHFVHAQGGEKDKDMDWTDNGVDLNKDYYYVIRALDKAGNSSGLVGDTYTIYASASPSPVAGGTTGGQAVILPKEESEGEVLGETSEPEASPAVVSTEEPKGVLGEAVTFAKNRTKLTVGIAVVVLGLVALAFAKLRRKTS